MLSSQEHRLDRGEMVSLFKVDASRSRLSRVRWRRMVIAGRLGVKRSSGARELLAEFMAYAIGE